MFKLTFLLKRYIKGTRYTFVFPLQFYGDRCIRITDFCNKNKCKLIKRILRTYISKIYIKLRIVLRERKTFINKIKKWFFSKSSSFLDCN